MCEVGLLEAEDPHVTALVSVHADLGLLLSSAQLPVTQKNDLLIPRRRHTHTGPGSLGLASLSIAKKPRSHIMKR